MGASSSIHPEIIVSSIEVSFVDKSGNLKSDKEIKQTSEKACKKFDYPVSFYDAYKTTKNYSEYAKTLRAVSRQI
jgi:hypothetical protein